MKRLSAAVVALLLLPGCFVFTSRSDGDQMQEEIRAIKMELVHMREAQNADRKEIETQVKKTQADAAGLETALENVKKTYGSNVADFGLEMDKIIQKLMELNGKYDLSAHRLDVIEAEWKRLREEAAAKQAKPGEAKRDPGQPAEKPGQLAEIKRPEKKKDYLALGVKMFNDGQWEASRVIFKEYNEKFKGDPNCGKAQYYLGESYFREGKYQNAVLEFQKVITDFPTSDKVEDASYSLALSFAQIGLVDDARKLLTEFVKMFPKSKLAPKAKKKLEELQKGK